MGTILHCLVHFPSAYFACCLYIALVEHTTEGYWAVQYTELLLQQNETEDYILKLIVVIVSWISASLVIWYDLFSSIWLHSNMGFVNKVSQCTKQ